VPTPDFGQVCRKGQLGRVSLAEGRSFLGVEAILAVDVADAPKVLRPVNGGHGAKAVKRVSATDPAREKQAVKELVQWERKVTACVRRIKRGERDIVLPAGTYHLWRHRGYSREEGRPPDQLFQAA